MVVVVDHFDVPWSIFPEGMLRYGDVSDAGFSNAGFRDRVEDLEFVMEQLVRWNSADPAFAGRLDLTKVAAIGGSWGGGVAGEFARLDDRAKAIVLLDPYFQHADDLLKQGLSKPFIEMGSTEFGGDTRLFDHRDTHSSCWFVISPSQHTQITRDVYWLTYPNDLQGGREVLRTVHDWTIWFLDKYLKRLDEPMPALKDYPRITGFKQK